MLVFPNAKINLGLLVKNRRPDGYHNIETVFYPVEWTDALEMVKSDTFSFETEGIHIPGDPAQNIVVEAWKLFDKAHTIGPIKGILQKHIPVGAGLGGGSADASFALKLLNTLFETGLSNDELKEIAVQLGADCSFFIDNQPVFASGIGDVFEPVDVDLSGHSVVVVYPRSGINTSWAYSQLKFDQPEMPSPKEVLSKPISEWKEHLRNDFEREVFKVLPVIKEIKSTFYDQGALYASMSGSGSSVFGIFEKGVDPEPIKEMVDDKGFKIYTGTLK